MKAFISSLVVIVLGVAALFVFAPPQSTSALAVASGTGQAQSPGQGNAVKGDSVQGAATAVPTCAPSWIVVSSPNAVSGQQQFGYALNQLTGVSVVSADDIWAVGYYNDPSASQASSPSKRVPNQSPHVKGESPTGYQSVLRTLVEHWDGSAWTIVPSPNVGTDNNALASVVAVAADDVWAVGNYLNEFGISQTLVEHWDGSAWSVVESANVGPLLDNYLTSIDAVAPDDVWAVGYYFNDVAVAQTLIQHWDGSTWSIVGSPNEGESNNFLYAVSVVGPDDVWAVGAYAVVSPNQYIFKALALHWNGVAWTVIDTPSVGSFNNVLYGVDAAASDDVWAVGYFSGSSGTRPLVEHWDGSTWEPIIGPELGAANGQLYDVVAISANDVWAVGQIGGYSSAPEPLSAHWDGIEWTQVRMPRPEPGPYGYSGYIALLSVDAVASQDLWAVGYFEGGPNYYDRQTLTEHYSTECVSCPTSFLDVPPGSPFYPYVQCMACQGIVSGYPCEDPADPCYPYPYPGPGTPYTTPEPTQTPVPGTRGYFRPSSPVTRGQLAKIISNSASFEDDPGPQMFEDVTIYDPFYRWVNQLARRGILAGYPCGTVPNEPCGYYNLPYFRPSANATRGQIAKILSNAKGYDDAIPASQQSFVDVPPSSPFWLYVERLRNNGSVISGYECGSAGESCPGIYFRPQNNASRGQVAKMVSKTFLANCYLP
ncbi:MAG TPA: S-layer homology domain-containing protein [Chloroflexia bacterium]|jgi:hypothetical protein|nr:S-layer homology domain-containing protein [Chloroflexia bacterium]